MDSEDVNCLGTLEIHSAKELLHYGKHDHLSA